MAVLDFPGDIVPLDKEQKGKLRKDLHPAQLLLICLNEICPGGPPLKPAEPPLDRNQSPEEFFHTFVNKLAQILNFDTGGKTISALAVILHNGKTTYVFASNDRTNTPLRNARNGLLEVLNILKSNIEAPSKEPDDVIEQRLLDKILMLNQRRIRGYINTLTSRPLEVLQTCINRCDTSKAEGVAAKGGLTQLANSLPKPALKITECMYIPSVIHTIRTVQSLQNTTLHRYISARAAEDHTMAKGGSWSVLKHVTGRLLSYQYAVEVLVHAHHIWANTDLFHDFEIESVRSSSPYTVTKDLLNPTPESAEMILNRAPGTSKRKEDMKIQAKELEKYSLGSAFHELWLKQVKGETEQIVHAEILLHSWLMTTEGGVHKTRFFQGWQYIGSSKPLCRMCTEYLSSIVTTPVRFRSGHPNWYLNWRFPDPYVDGKLQGKSEREKDARIKWSVDLKKMKGKVFETIGEVLKTRVAEWKRFDSNTYTSKVLSMNGDAGGSNGDVGMLTEWMGGLRM